MLGYMGHCVISMLVAIRRPVYKIIQQTGFGHGVFLFGGIVLVFVRRKAEMPTHF